MKFSIILITFDIWDSNFNFNIKILSGYIQSTENCWSLCKSFLCSQTNNFGKILTSNYSVGCKNRKLTKQSSFIFNH